jgi:hypothetical protein
MIQVKRRDLLAGLGGMSFCVAAGCTPKDIPAQETAEAQKEPLAEAPAEVAEKFDLKMRPHHIVDIITSHGQGVEWTPAESGHSQHIIAPQLLENSDLKIKLIVNNDDLCKGCIHLMPDGKCADVLAQLTPSPSKQAYNDVLDCRLLDQFEIEINSVMTMREYLAIINGHVPGIEDICTHPKEDKAERLTGLTEGLIKLGIREKA